MHNLPSKRQENHRYLFHGCSRSYECTKTTLAKVSHASPYVLTVGVMGRRTLTPTGFPSEGRGRVGSAALTVLEEVPTVVPGHPDVLRSQGGRRPSRGQQKIEDDQ